MAGLSDLYQLSQRMPEAIGMYRGRPNYGYGNRWNSQDPKQQGYYGEVSRPDGKISGEISVESDLGQIPTMVPGLSLDEMNWLLSSDPSAAKAFKSAERLPASIYNKAYDHAAMRRLQGLDPFATVQDPMISLPSNRNGVSLSDLLRR